MIHIILLFSIISFLSFTQNLEGIFAGEGGGAGGSEEGWDKVRKNQTEKAKGEKAKKSKFFSKGGESPNETVEETLTGSDRDKTGTDKLEKAFKEGDFKTASEKEIKPKNDKITPDKTSVLVQQENDNTKLKRVTAVRDKQAAGAERGESAIYGNKKGGDAAPLVGKKKQRAAGANSKGDNRDKTKKPKEHHGDMGCTNDRSGRGDDQKKKDGGVFGTKHKELKPNNLSNTDANCQEKKTPKPTKLSEKIDKNLCEPQC